jgi:hypothetical protein
MVAHDQMAPADLAEARRRLEELGWPFLCLVEARAVEVATGWLSLHTRFAGFIGQDRLLDCLGVQLDRLPRV